MPEPDRRRLARLEELFAAARELPAAERPAFVAAQCGDDASLRAELTELLDVAREAGGFLEQAADPWVGRRIDRWRIGRRLGSGGMGVVYLAVRDDGAFQQEAALKLLKHGFDRAEALDRFRRERQLLAGLAHPNIARLLDGGATEDGVPYLVMEHVAGKRLDDWCDERRLPIARRLALFLDVCAAVHCAHQHLVIHRDLKPSNVLVDGDGTAKLLDFGIAKELEPADGRAATRTLDRRLTPEYSSPEVVRGGAITMASDVFSLGVILYELLTGSRPWRAAETSPTDLERAICETTPPRPSAALLPDAAAAARATDPARLRCALRGDLDAIVMTALAPEPERRYASVESLAADVARHLRHEPIVARPPGTAYLLSKFVRRRRGVVAALAFALLALIGGVVGLVAGMQHARRQAETTARVNQLLRDMLVQLEPATARGFGDSLLRQLHFANEELGKGLLDGEPAIEADLRFALGRVYGAFGYAGWASGQFRKALALQVVIAPQPDTRRVELLRRLGWAERNAAEFSAAIVHLREAVAMAATLPGLDDEQTAACNELGLALTAVGEHAEADRVLREALERQRARGQERSAATGSLQIALALNALARDELDAAEPSARAALALYEELLPENEPRRAIALDTLARVLRARGRFAEAQPLLERSLALRRSLYDAMSPVIAWSCSLLAELHLAAGRPAEAAPLLAESLQIRRVRYDLDSQLVVQSQLQLGLALVDAGRGDEARIHLAEAVAMADQKGYSQEPLLPRGREELARLGGK
jgi:serine/threonine-protein kinase